MTVTLLSSTSPAGQTEDDSSSDKGTESQAGIPSPLPCQLLWAESTVHTWSFPTLQGRCSPHPVSQLSTLGPRGLGDQPSRKGGWGTAREVSCDAPCPVKTSWSWCWGSGQHSETLPWPLCIGHMRARNRTQLSSKCT